ncbi:MAG: NDP-sugar synthase [Candidatus Aminicenantes bacterium]|nr:NDP-sugar synthase [Candidatus Aminicenantes bacterium]
MKFFILAGGFGKRAEPLSLIKPKAAFPLNGIPLLRLLLEQLRAQGCAEGFVNLHHLAEQVMQAAGADSGIDFIREKELSGSLVLRQALPFFSDWLLVVNGDTFLEIPLSAMVEKTADRAVDGVLLTRRDPCGRYGRLRSRDGVFLAVSPPGPGPGMMYAGAALFRKSAVEKIDDKNFFSSITKHRLHFRTVPYEGIWLDVGTPESYLRANERYRAHVGERSANSLSAAVTISPQALVKNSILWEHTRLGDGVSLCECIVTGHVALENMALQKRIITRRGIFPLETVG